MSRRVELMAMLAVWAGVLALIVALVFPDTDGSPEEVARSLVGEWLAEVGQLSPRLYTLDASPQTAAATASEPASAEIQLDSTAGLVALGRPLRPAARRGGISIGWAGDITPGSSYGLPPEHGRSLFRGVRGALRRPDLMVGNLEGTFSVGGGSKCGSDTSSCFSFQAPPGNAEALRWAGFDLMNVANNHAIDFGADGQKQTVAALDEVGIRHTGLPGEVTVVERAGVRIATVGFAPYFWASDLRNLQAASDLIRAAAGEADIVVVLAHIGGEGRDQERTRFGPEVAFGEDRGDTRAFAHAAVAAGADLVLGSGPHVLRGIEIHHGKLIAYSLGNFAGWHNFSTAGTLALSGLLTVRLSRGGNLLGGKFASIRLSGAGAPAPDATGESAQLVNRLSNEDFGPSGLVLGKDGSF